MTRSTNRSFLKLAQAQNRAMWGELLDTIPEATIAELEHAADIAQAHWLRDRRDRLVKRINEASENPSSFYRSVYFTRLIGGIALSADEAVTELRKLIALNKRKHWSARPGLIPAFQEAMVFARYFRRHGQAIWLAPSYAHEARIERAETAYRLSKEAV